MTGPETLRIFCGADRSQQLPFKVLAHSIERHTDRPVDIRLIDNAASPAPTDPRHAPYTEFSFARFAIPALCGFAGKAVYMDSDMLVFADMAELWDVPLGQARIAIEIGSRDQETRGRHAAMMLLDCSRLAWNVDDIVAGLGTRYDYNALMAIDPLLQPGDMQELIPAGWNDLDRYAAGHTRNLHYTEIRTQPWVFAGHPHGDLWVRELRSMLDSGEIDADEVRAEVAEGFARPSLLVELALEPAPPAGRGTEALQAYDRERGFVAHSKLLARFADRKRAIARVRRDDRVHRQPWAAWWHKLVYRYRHGRD
jgi:hypothetical protein